MTVGTAIEQLKVAVYSTLTTLSSPLQGSSSTGVFDSVAPTNQPFPYLVMAQSTEIADDTLGKAGREVTITFGVWSQEQGSKQGMTLYDLLLQALVHQETTISGYMSTLSCRMVELDNFSEMREPDGLTLHLAPRLKFTIQEL